jgi:periplasmic protein TonB
MGGRGNAMTRLTFSFVLIAVLLFAANGQVVAGFPKRVQVDSKIANTLLIHKEEPACQKSSDGTRVTGTVVFAITIDKSGNVIHVRTVSGPKMLRPLALAAVRKYRYKPYLLDGTPVEVVTVVSIPIVCCIRNGQA